MTFERRHAEELQRGLKKFLDAVKDVRALASDPENKAGQVIKSLGIMDLLEKERRDELVKKLQKAFETLENEWPR